MNGIEFKYNIISRKDQKRSDRIQLFIASFSLVTGYSDSIKDYTGILILLPIISFSIAIINIGILITYNYFIKKYGYRLEAIVFRINGIMILLTALGFQFIGNHNVQYVMYVIAVCYLFVLPNIVIQKRGKMIIRFLPEKISVFRRWLKPLEYDWYDIETISVKNTLIILKQKNVKKRRRYFLIVDDPETLKRLNSLLIQQSKTYHFTVSSLS